MVGWEERIGLVSTKKNNKKLSFDGFRGPTDEFLLQHFLKPTNDS